MLKRFITFICILAVCLSFFVFPVNASPAPIPFVNPNIPFGSLGIGGGQIIGIEGILNSIFQWLLGSKSYPDWVPGDIESRIDLSEDIFDQSGDTVKKWAEWASKEFEMGTTAVELPDAVRYNLEGTYEDITGEKIITPIYEAGALNNLNDNLSEATSYDFFQNATMKYYDESLAIQQEQVYTLYNLRAFMANMWDELIILNQTMTDSALDYDFWQRTIADLNAATVSVMESTYQLLNDRIDTLQTKLNSFASRTDSQLGSLQTTLSNLRSNMISYFEGLQLTLSTFRTQMVSYSEALQTSVSTFRTQVVYAVDAMQSTISNFRTFVITGFEDLNVSITNLATKIETLVVDIPSQFGIRSNVAEDALVVSDYGAIENGAMNDNDDGKQIAIGYIGSTRDTLSQHSSSFLVAGLLFQQFADVPLFAQLLQASLGICVCAIFLNLGLDVARKERRDVMSKNYFKRYQKGG